MTEKYIVFHHSEDGETDCSLMTEKEILDIIKESDEDFPIDFLNELPGGYGWDYCGECFLIIKGEIIVPKPIHFYRQLNHVEKITKWEL